MGRAIVKEIFDINNLQDCDGVNYLGVEIIEGSLKVNKYIKVNDFVTSYKIKNLKRFKDNVLEVKAGQKCGLQTDGFLNIKVGDMIETLEDNMKIIPKEDFLFIISSQELKMPGKMVYAYHINEEIFNKVENFYNLFKETFDGWLNKNDGNGNCFYWEENMHDKVVKVLSQLMPGCDVRDIGNSLSALGA